MAIDARGDHLLTASLDSNVQVWSMASLLSFSPSQDRSSQTRARSSIRTLSSHRAAVNAVVVGHGSSHANIAVSASVDESCIVWDYHTGTVLHTFLMASIPLCLVLDPVDRGFYTGYGDGSIHFVDFYNPSSNSHRVYDFSLALTPTQPSPDQRWELPIGSKSAAFCIGVSYDGTTLLSGHENGRIHTWEVLRGRYNTTLADLAPSQVTNIVVLPPTGFPHPKQPSITTQSVIKPRYESSLTIGHPSGTIESPVPNDYTFAAQFSSLEFASKSSASSEDMLRGDKDPMASFRTALFHPSFPDSILEHGLLALRSRKGSSKQQHTLASDDAVLLQEELAKVNSKQKVEEHNTNQLARELYRLQERERLRKQAKQRRDEKRAVAAETLRKQAMGEIISSGVDPEELNGDDISSTTEQMSGAE